MKNGSKTIVVVDDDEDFVFQQKKQLEALGFTVLTAASSKEARQMLRQAKPDLAIVDLMMEEQDAGFSLCHLIKKQMPALPVILCTGVLNETGMEFDAATQEEKSWVKADVLLQKPLRFEQLKREIDRLLPA
jgi:CheY-like chemotaxis protein